MMGVLGITMGVMVWAAVALLGLNLIPAKMAWLHNIIMVGGGLYLCWMGYQMLRGALKKEEKTQEPKVELATGGRSFVKGLLTNGEPESDYLFRFRLLPVRGRQRGGGCTLGYLPADRG